MGELAAVSSAAQGINSAVGGIAQGSAIKAKGQYEASQLDFNARLAELDAQESVRIGREDAAKFKREGKKVIGAQRAGYAAQGLDVSQGSAAEVTADTRRQVAEDARTVMNNAWRRAWGFKVQASDYKGAAAMTRIGSKGAARQTMIAGGMSALSDFAKAGYYQYQYGGSSDSYATRAKSKAGDVDNIVTPYFGPGY